MKHPDASDLWRKDFIATLRLISSAAARLPYGVPEPVLGGDAAIELYSGGLWPTRQLELLAPDTRRLQAELMGTGFHRDECSPSFSVSSLWHPTLGCGVSMTVRPAPNTNVVAVEIGTASPHDATTIRVVGIEDLIADQITGAIGQGGRRSEMATLVQVLVELGRAGVAGPFRAAYLQRRLARESGGEAVLETPPAP